RPSRGSRPGTRSAAASATRSWTRRRSEEQRDPRRRSSPDSGSVLRPVLTPVEESAVLDRLVAWASTSPAVRALILTSSRARSDGSADALSDYDVVVAV